MKQLPGFKSPFAFAAFGKKFNNDPYAAMDELHQTYGEVVAVSAGLGPRLVFLFGRAGNQFIISERKDSFEFREAYKSLIPVDGETALVVSDGPAHARRRRLVQPAFRPHPIDGYIPMFAQEADRVIDSLPDGGMVDAHLRFRSGIRRSVVRALFGDHLYAQADEIGETLEPALAFVNLPPQQQIKMNVVGSRYYAAVKSRRDTDRIIDAEIRRRRAAGTVGTNDVLGMLLNSGDDEVGLSDPEIRDQVVSLIAAGYDTTSAAMAWMLYELMINPGVWDRALGEVNIVLGRRELTVPDLAKLSYCDGIVQEALRLHPPVAAARHAANKVEFKGYTIPKGSTVLYSAYITQRDPELWSDPNTFKPERWDKTLPSYKEPQPGSFVTFGGGQRRCIGFGFATLELKVYLVQVLRRLRLEPAFSGEIRPMGIATVKPRGGIPVRVTKLP